MHASVGVGKVAQPPAVPADDRILTASGFRSPGASRVPVWAVAPGGTTGTRVAKAPAPRRKSELDGENMNWDRIEGNWKQFRGNVKEKWGKLTDDQLDVIAGKRDQLAGKLQEAYGYSKDEAARQISDWESGLPDDESTSNPRRPS